MKNGGRVYSTPSPRGRGRGGRSSHTDSQWVKKEKPSLPSPLPSSNDAPSTHPKLPGPSNSDEATLAPPTTLLPNESHLSLHSAAGQQSSNTTHPCPPHSEPQNSHNLPVIFDPFDICLPITPSHVKLKPSLLAQNKEKRNLIIRALQQEDLILRPGMVHLKSFLSIDDQVKIVKHCQNLGLGPGGFYQPGYRDGAKLHLKMMCLGKNWDPDTGAYGDIRPVDDAKPPTIPDMFCQLVEKAMQDSLALLERNANASSAEDFLPQMTPDICIVNFYSTSGCLGLHQDKDESEGSLSKGLPVVSFSIGDIGEFLYGVSRDEKNTDKIFLESGDVLIFGGKSRHIFHGVRSVHPDTAPKSLVEKTNLRAGRLNLTFRQY